MRIALFSSSIDAKDGYGNITYELCMHHAAHGVEFTLFLPRSQQQVVESLSLPFPVYCVLPEYIFRIYQPKALKYWRTVDISDFDVVHSLFAFPYCFIAARSARKYRKPFLMGAQGTHGVRPLTYWPERLLLKWCYRIAQHIVVPSEFTQRMIQEYAHVHYPIEIIHNGVHFERFQKDTNVAELRRQHPNHILLLTVGGLWGRKGHDLVLRALALVLEQRDDVLYIIVGAGNTRPALEQLAHDLGVESHVFFAGPQRGDDLVRYFQACDIYVHTPRVTGLKFEGFGIVYLEASACGKPIVATDSGGIRDAVLHDKTGLVVSDQDINGIADAILAMCVDESLRRRLGDAGREYACQHDWSFVARQFEKLYGGVHA